MEKTSRKSESQLGKFFHENTKQHETSLRKKNAVDYDLFPMKKKVYPIEKYKVNIPKEDNVLIKAINNRKSYDMLNVRTPIPVNDVSLLLSLSYTVQNHGSNRSELIRTVPSAGGRYPINLYLIVFNIKTLKKGIYYWDPENSELCLLEEGDFRSLFKSCICDINSFDIEFCSFVIITTAEMEKTLGKYGDRGYRYICIDAGHISQNLYLTSSYLKLACKAIGGYYDNQISNFLGLNQEDEIVLLVHIFGKEYEKTHVQLNLDFNSFFKNNSF